MKKSKISPKIEEQVKFDDDFVETIVNGVPSIICRFTPSGQISFINAAIEKMISVKASDLIGENWFDLFCVGETQQKIADICPKTSEVFTSDLELSFEYEGQSTKMISWRLLKKCNKESGECFFLAVGNDMTSQYTAIKEKKKLESLLIDTQKLEAIGTLAGGIAHDFNNILASAIGYTELCLDDAPEDSLLYQNLQQVLISGLRAKDLVQQILCFSRQSDHTFREVKVSLIIKEILKLLRSTIPSTIKLSQNIKSNSSVWCEPVQIQQILTNLCTNAAHSMHAEGGRLTVELTDIELDFPFTSQFRGVKAGKFVRLKIMDTGHGIKAEAMSRIFEPFYTTKPEGEGTGLGLSVVHGIVTRLKGIIIPFSVPEEGTCFDIYLPVTKEGEDIQKPAKEVYPTGTEKILVVDDEIPIVELEKMILEQLGYEVVGVTYSPQALKIYKEADPPFDMVITDMTMPDMVGTELSRKILEFDPDANIVLCTGFSELITEEDAKKLGIKAFIHKPILRAHIAKVVRNIIDQNRSSNGKNSIS